MDAVVRNFLNNKAAGILKYEALVNLRQKFHLSKEEANKVYNNWREDFIKPTISAEELLKFDDRKYEVRKIRTKDLLKEKRQKVLEVLGYVHNISSENITAIAELRHAGKTNSEIAEILNIEKTLVEVIIDKLRYRKVWTIKKGWLC